MLEVPEVCEGAAAGGRHRGMSTEIQSPWFTVAEAASYAKVGEDAITRWIGEGRLRPAITRNKRNLKGRGAAGYLIERDDLDRFLRSLKANVAEATGEPGDSADASAEKPKRKVRLRPGRENLAEMLERDKA